MISTDRVFEDTNTSAKKVIVQGSVPLVPNTLNGSGRYVDSVNVDLGVIEYKYFAFDLYFTFTTDVYTYSYPVCHDKGVWGYVYDIISGDIRYSNLTINVNTDLIGSATDGYYEVGYTIYTTATRL